MHKVLNFFGVSKDRPIRYGEDNAAAAAFVHSDKLTSRVRWFDVCIFRLRELDRARRFVCVKVDTRHQLADPLTKNLTAIDQKQHRLAILGLGKWAVELAPKDIRDGTESKRKKAKNK